MLNTFGAHVVAHMIVRYVGSLGMRAQIGRGPEL